MSATEVWTKQRCRAAAKVLAKYGRAVDALGEIEAEVGVPCRSVNSLLVAFQRHGMKGPSTYLKRPDPVMAREAAETKARERASLDALVDDVRELRKRQAFLDKFSAKAPPIIPARERTSGIREMTAIVLASDWHVEETVEPETVMYLNEYNLKIADKRVEKFFGAVEWMIEHERGSGRIAVRDLVLWLGGDLMSGYIHEELEESNGLSPTQTIRWLQPRIEGGIRGLLDRLNLESLVVPCSFGNHGRTTKKPRVSTAYKNSYEWLMYHYLADSLKDDKRVRFEITSAAHQYVRTYDFLNHFHHGDHVNYQGGVGGIGIPLLKAVPSWNTMRPSDYHYIGHWHQFNDFRKVVVNGSLVGYSPYSVKIKAEYEDPAQALVYIDSKRGKTMTKPLWVASRRGDRT